MDDQSIKNRETTIKIMKTLRREGAMLKDIAQIMNREIAWVSKKLSTPKYLTNKKTNGKI